MTHLTMEQLLALREPGSEPGAAAAREHAEQCAACAAELERLHQRVARLKALPALAPSRDRWPMVAARRRRDHRLTLLRQGGIAALAMAASIAAFVIIGGGTGSPERVVPTAVGELARVKENSQALESVLESYNPEARVVDGHTARMATALEDRIADVDERLQAAELRRNAADQQAELLQLWRERVGLLDALVDVHVTRASNVGL